MSDVKNGGPAFPSKAYLSVHDTEPSDLPGMFLRQYAAIKLSVPESGTEWLDDMIRKRNRDWFAGKYQVWKDTEGNLMGYSDNVLAEMLGIEYPDWNKLTATGSERIRISMQLHIQIGARLKLMHADAMLAAREAKP